VTREDQYGDATNNNAVTSDDRTITRTFSPNLTAWILSLPSNEILYQGIGTGIRLAQTDVLYDGTGSNCAAVSGSPTPSKGHATVVTRQHLTDATKHAVVKYAYDAYGNRICTWSPSGISGGSTNTVAYDSTFMFPRILTNHLGHTVILQYYGVDGQAADFGLYGQVKSVTDPNGRTMNTKYDAFGRKTDVTEPTATGTFTTTFAYVNVGQGIGTDPVGKQHVYTTNSLNLASWTFFDGFGRTLSAHKAGPGGGTGPNIIVDTQYDVRGMVSQTSVPYFAGGNPTWQTMTYDPLGRATQVEQPSPGGTLRTRACFDQWVTVSIDANDHWKRQTHDAYGRLAKVEEFTTTFADCPTSLGATTPYALTQYLFDVPGNLTKTIDAKNNETTMTYDSLGRKTSMHDSDMGTWSYEYDAAGNLTKQTDAKGQVACFEHDALNRGGPSRASERLHKPAAV
jgi:YD repeat-containing protein